MDFEQTYRSIFPTPEVILELVDEYTLYCYYTGIDDLAPGRVYCAPYYRKDDNPSFSMYVSNRSEYQYMWKDHATGARGHIFHLIMAIEGLATITEVCGRINHDFALGLGTNDPVRRDKIVWFEKPPDNQIKISIVPYTEWTEKGKTFWKPFRIERGLLDEYGVDQVQFYWSYVGQPAPTTAPDPTFSYRIGKSYQLYSPYALKINKFRNDWPENYFFGYLQLPERGDKLVIDKSSKDVIFCRRLGYNAVCGKSETTFIPERKIIELKNRFDKVYLTLDNDKPGRIQSEKYLSLYPWLHVRFIPQELAKDKTDLCRAVGFEEAERIITQMLA